MKVALLSNVTVEILAGMLKGEHDVWTPSGYGAWMETALEPPAEMVAFDPALVCLLIDRRFGAFDASVQNLQTAMARLQTRFPRTAVVAPDLERLAADLGEGFYDEKMWKLGKMPFSLRGLRELAKLFTPKKVLAVDLDNTLWEGVVGEDGVGGVTPDVAFQRQVRELKERGVLLVALSKNNAEDVEPMWDDPRMVLRKDDFVRLCINWDAKADNLAKVAAELNLGVDSFVFVDDRAAERLRMRAALPAVAVADFPPQLDVFFPRLALTDEDRRKTEMYRAEARRRELAAGMSVDDYLAELGIWAKVRPIHEDEISRVAQLSQKTNQFNVCTNRYAEAEIAAMAADADRLFVTVRSGDRFGDNGLVAFVQATIRGDEAEIVDWVMSCRVMGRRLEFAVEDEVERLLAERGVRRLTASWRKTAKNAPVADLFDRFGFSSVRTTATEKSYACSLPKPTPSRHAVKLLI